jgi:hypothetical protein
MENTHGTTSVSNLGRGKQASGLTRLSERDSEDRWMRVFGDTQEERALWFVSIFSLESRVYSAGVVQEEGWAEWGASITAAYPKTEIGDHTRSHDRRISINYPVCDWPAGSVWEMTSALGMCNEGLERRQLVC